jgi:hypothetical protein
MNNDAVRVNQFDVWVIFPSLRLLDAVRYAFSLQCLLPAFLTVICVQLVRAAIGIPGFRPEHVAVSLTGELVYSFAATSHALFREDVLTISSVIGRLAIMLGLISITGFSIARCAGLSLCRGQRVGAMSSLRRAFRQWRSLLAGLMIYLMLIVGIGFMARIVLWVSHLIPAWSFPMDPGDVVRVIVAATSVLSMLVLTSGWLLSLAAMGIDECEGPEGLSRGISYVLSHFRRTVCYAFSTGFAVWGASAATFWILQLCRSLAGPQLQLAAPGKPDSTAMFLAGTCGYSLLMSAVAVSYVLLRRFEDGISITEVAATRSAGTQRRQA